MTRYPADTPGCASRCHDLSGSCLSSSVEYTRTVSDRHCFVRECLPDYDQPSYTQKGTSGIHLLKTEQFDRSCCALRSTRHLGEYIEGKRSTTHICNTPRRRDSLHCPVSGLYNFVEHSHASEAISPARTEDTAFSEMLR